ncbi:MAG: hypothetical protein L6R45_11040 [Anaerolineae bacterium]|nr:hypothetical protein [Anaerolineae bacterium]
MNRAKAGLTRRCLVALAFHAGAGQSDEIVSERFLIYNRHEAKNSYHEWHK